MTGTDAELVAIRDAAYLQIQPGSGEPVHTFRWLRDVPPYVAIAAGHATPDWRHGTVVGLGVHHDRTYAARAAINEVIERQSAFRLPRAPVLCSPAADLGWTGIGTGWWITGTTSAGAIGTFPLEHAQFALPERHPRYASRGDTSGMAVHVTEARASAAAVAELAERALRRTVLCAPAAGRWTQLPGRAADYARLLGDRGVAVAVIPVRGGPWWACVVLARGVSPAGIELLLGGSAAAYEPGRAAERALAEVFAKAQLHSLGMSTASSITTGPAVTADQLAGWIRWFGSDTAAEIPFGTANSVLEPFTDPYLLDRGCAYTDAKELFCRQAVAPGTRLDLPSDLASTGGVGLFERLRWPAPPATSSLPPMCSL